MKNIFTILIACVVVPIHTIMWYLPVICFARNKADYLITPKDLWEDITYEIFYKNGDEDE